MWEKVRCARLCAAFVLGSAMAMAQVEPPPAAATSAPAVRKGTLNLELNGVGADEGFDQLGKQAGVDIAANDPQLWANAEPIDLQVKDGYFWPTLIEMCGQARLRFNPHYGNGRSVMLERMTPEQQKMPALPMSAHEGTIVRATYANRSATVNYESPNPGNSSSQFSIQLSVLMDPGLTTMGATQVVATEAADDRGNSLVPPGRDGSMMFGGQDNQLILQAAVNLLCPKEVGTKITKLKGYVRTTTAAKSELVEIESPLKAEPHTKETPEYTITIGPLKPGQGTPKSYELKVTFQAKERKPGGLRRQSSDLWTLINRIELRDADGKRLGYAGGGGGGGPVQEYTVRYRAESAGEPAKLVWRIPTEIRELRIPFEFMDLAIPQL